MEHSVRLYSLSYKDVRTYLTAFLFIMGNIVLPQLFHLIPGGGIVWLPIYFFTLIGAYKYGWKVGLLTAFTSPLLNCVLFGMPSLVMLPAILLKSILLALTAGWASNHYQKISIPILGGVVFVYQLIGMLGEWILNGSLQLALQDLRIGAPGLLVQIFGGYLLIKYVIRK